MKKIELLAPAGSLDILKAVVCAGADAVYIGGNMFSARAYATNFTPEEVIEAIDYCHMYGVKLHLTINTCLKDKEIDSLFFYVAPFYEAGLDAVIVQDMGVFSVLKTYFPDLEIHASTQTTLCSAKGVGLMKKLGATRAVLARELSINEIDKIHITNPDIELETFIHGALCFSYSGQCLFSSFLGNRSGNRGRCAGPCRLGYSVCIDDKRVCNNKYPLSLKDFCGIRHLKELIDAGVSSLKIEGRMKSASYAAGVTYLYRQAIDLIYEGEEIPSNFTNKLLELGNRSGFTDAYLTKHNGSDMVSLDSPAHTSNKDDYIPKFRDKLEVICEANFEEGKLPSISYKYNEHRVNITGDVLIEPANKAPTQLDDVKAVLMQTGDTLFSVSKIDVSLENNLFIPKSLLKKLRRSALDELKNCIVKDNKRVLLDKTTIDKSASINDNSVISGKVYVSVANTQQLSIVANYSIVDAVIIPIELFNEQIIEQLNNKKILLVLPKIIRDEKVSLGELATQITRFSDKISGFVASNYDALGMLIDCNISPEQIITDASIYTYNNHAIDMLHAIAVTNIMPLELSFHDMKSRNNANSIISVYGHAPYMITAQCLNGNLNGCNKKSANVYMTDRYNKRLRVINNCKYCYNTIYNPLPTVLFDKISEIKSLNPLAIKLDFTIENEDETSMVMDLFKSIYVGNNIPSELPFEFTRGHFKKGVE